MNHLYKDTFMWLLLTEDKTMMIHLAQSKAFLAHSKGPGFDSHRHRRSIFNFNDIWLFWGDYSLSGKPLNRCPVYLCSTPSTLKNIWVYWPNSLYPNNNNNTIIHILFKKVYIPLEQGMRTDVLWCSDNQCLTVKHSISHEDRNIAF